MDPFTYLKEKIETRLREDNLYAASSDGVVRKIKEVLTKVFNEDFPHAGLYLSMAAMKKDDSGNVLDNIIKSAYAKMVEEVEANVPGVDKGDTKLRRLLYALAVDEDDVKDLTKKKYTADSFVSSIANKLVSEYRTLLRETGFEKEFLNIFSPAKKSALRVIVAVLEQIDQLSKTGSFECEELDVEKYDSSYKFVRTVEAAFVMDKIANFLVGGKRDAFIEAVNLDYVSPALGILIEEGKPALAKIIATHFVRKAQDAPAAGAPQTTPTQTDPTTGVSTIETVDIAGKKVNKKCFEDAIRAGRSYEDAINSCAIGG